MNAQQELAAVELAVESVSSVMSMANTLCRRSTGKPPTSYWWSRYCELLYNALGITLAEETEE